MKRGLSNGGLMNMALLAVALLLLVGCGSTPAPATQAPAAQAPTTQAPLATEPAQPTAAPAGAGEQVLVVATDLDVTGLDPAVIYDLSQRNIALLYEGLVTLKGDTMEIVPALAETWDISADGLAYTFHLRQGVKFHDGTLLTADAVKKSFDRFMAIGKTTAWLFKDVLGEVKVIDDLTVEMDLTRPYAPFLSLLTSIAGPMIVSPTALDANWGDDMAQGWLFDHAVGTGPYKLDSWDPGQQTLTLVKNQDYWKGWEGSHIDKVIFRYIVETSTRKLMLENGEVDIALSLNPDELASLAGVQGITIDEKPTMRIFVVFMNNQKGPLQDVKVRQALAYAMDYSAVQQGVYNGKLAPLCGPLPPNDPNAFPCDKYPYKLDMEKAKALLAESSYPEGGFALEATVMEGDFAFLKTAEILQAQLAELNIQVNITELAWSTEWEQVGNLDTAPDLAPLRNYPDFPDSSSIYANQYASSAWGSNGWNLSYYKNDRVDELLKSTTETTDPAVRGPAFQEMGQIVVDEVPNLFIGTIINQMAMRDNVKGFVFNPVYVFLMNVYDMSKQSHAAGGDGLDRRPRTCSLGAKQLRD
jgi:peptide/nickel transport system substrate-binding protein